MHVDRQPVGADRGRSAHQPDGKGVLAVAGGAGPQSVAARLQGLVEEGVPGLSAGGVGAGSDHFAAPIDQLEGGAHRLDIVGLVAVVTVGAVIGGVELGAVEVEPDLSTHRYLEGQGLVAHRPHQPVADAGQGQRGADVLGGGVAKGSGQHQRHQHRQHRQMVAFRLGVLSRMDRSRMGLSQRHEGIRLSLAGPALAALKLLLAACCVRLGVLCASGCRTLGGVLPGLHFSTSSSRTGRSRLRRAHRRR